MNFWKLHKIPILFFIISVAFYCSFAYDLERADFLKLISLYAALFVLFAIFLNRIPKDFKLLMWIAIGFRLVFLFAIPNLSQDFYRFIWDGRLLLEGINPYLYTPEYFITHGEFPIAQAQELYDGMGSLSASHYTNYPPVKQLCFAIAGIFAGKSILGSVVVIRLLIIAADIGTLYFGKKLLDKLNIPVHTIFWYILNPFIIIELTGNLHFEGVMIFFLIWSVYLLHSGKWKLSAFIFALSVSVKLIPLLFLPLLIQYLGWKKSIKYYGIVGVSILLLFAPYYASEFVNNYVDTIGLWFQNFEFNASLYYVMREIGYLFRGWNEIAIIGKIIPVVVLVMVISLAFFRNNKSTKSLITAMLFALSFYFFSATTVHPWYIATLLMLSIFTNYKFPLIWSFVIMLSYFAYSNLESQENLWLVALEYVVVYGVLFWELFKPKNIIEEKPKNSKEY